MRVLTNNRVIGRKLTAQERGEGAPCDICDKRAVFLIQGLSHPAQVEISLGSLDAPGVTLLCGPCARAVMTGGR